MENFMDNGDTLEFSKGKFSKKRSGVKLIMYLARSVGKQIVFEYLKLRRLFFANVQKIFRYLNNPIYFE
jgi:hypothetical protein